MSDVNDLDGRSARKGASRQRLLESAFEILDRDGVEAVTMRKLADAAKMSPKTVYNVFGSKAELLNAMLESLPNRQVSMRPPQMKGDLLDEALAGFDFVTNDWTQPASPIPSLIKATKRTGQIAPLMLPKVRRGLTKLMERFEKKGWTDGSIPAPILADRIAYANAGLFDAFLDDAITKKGLWANHRLNFLIPLRAVCIEDKRPRITTAIAATLDHLLPTSE